MFWVVLGEEDRAGYMEDFSSPASVSRVLVDLETDLVYEEEVSTGATALVDDEEVSTVIVEDETIEGELSKKKDEATWKRRYFVFRDDRVAYFNKRGDTKPRGELELDEHARVLDYLGRQHAFQVISNNLSLTVSADCEEECAQWKRVLQAAIDRMDGGDGGAKTISGGDVTTRSDGGGATMSGGGGDDASTPRAAHASATPSTSGGGGAVASGSGRTPVAIDSVISPGGHDFELPKCYSFIKLIGHGAYGVVISADEQLGRDASAGRSGLADGATGSAGQAALLAAASPPRTPRHESGDDTPRRRARSAEWPPPVRQVAIKKVPNMFDDLVDARRVVREIRLLRHFRHDNVICISDLFTPASQHDDFQDVYIVSELMQTDLHRVLYSNQHLSEEHVQFFLCQLLCALKYIHSASVLHRDIKPSNILVNANCDLKVSLSDERARRRSSHGGAARVSATVRDASRAVRAKRRARRAACSPLRCAISVVGERGAGHMRACGSGGTRVGRACRRLAALRRRSLFGGASLPTGSQEPGSDRSPSSRHRAPPLHRVCEPSWTSLTIVAYPPRARPLARSRSVLDCRRIIAVVVVIVGRNPNKNHRKPPSPPTMTAERRLLFLFVVLAAVRLWALARHCDHDTDAERRRRGGRWRPRRLEHDRVCRDALVPRA